MKFDIIETGFSVICRKDNHIDENFVGKNGPNDPWTPVPKIFTLKMKPRVN